MKRRIFSKKDFAVYAGFMVNISAGFFIVIFTSDSLPQLIFRISITIITLYLAVILGRRSK